MAVGNSVNDEIREQRQKFKDMTPKQKFGYFWDYYKWPAVVVLFVAISVISFVYNLATQKDTVLYVDCLNGDPMAETQAIEEGFVEAIGLSYKDYTVSFNPSVQLDLEQDSPYSLVGYQKLMAEAGSNTLDILIGQSEILMTFAADGYYRDLSELFPADYLAAHEKDLIYFAGEEEDKDPFPIAIRIASAPCLVENGIYFNGDENVYFTVLTSSSRSDTALSFYEYLTGETLSP